MLDPRRLLTFREVARQGSFSRAAEALALTQPAVSQQVGALERELGATLLTRGRTGAAAGALREGGGLPKAAAPPRREHEGLRRVDLAQVPMVAVLPASHRLAGRK